MLSILKKKYNIGVSSDMAYLCTSGEPVCPVPESYSGRDQLAITGLHGGGHTAQLCNHLDAGYSWTEDNGTNCLFFFKNIICFSIRAQCEVYSKLWNTKF